MLQNNKVSDPESFYDEKFRRRFRVPQALFLIKNKRTLQG